MTTKTETNGKSIAKWEPSGPRAFLKREEAMLSEYVTRAAGREYRPFELSALMLIQDTPALQECLRSKEGEASLRNALMRAAATGLSLNPADGKATIIAYGGKARYQIMKAGMIEIAIASGSVQNLTADVVHDADEWEFEKTVDGDRFRHRPAKKARGAAVGYYAACKILTGEAHVKYLTREEVEAHRDSYRSNKRDDSMWATSFDGAALKTVIKALLRNLHLAPAAREFVTLDDRDEVGDWDVETVHVGSSSSDITDAIRERAAEPEPSPPADLETGRKEGDLL